MHNCLQCEYMDLSNTNSFGDAWCKVRKTYYSPYSPVCKDVSYVDDSDDTREKEYENNYSNDDTERNNGADCYLTTAMCDVLGYGDDCYYLKMLRDFRDHYMMKDKDCLELLIEYEVIGPIISKHILNDKETANIMLDNYITKAILFIRKNEFKKAIEVYKEMVYYLKDKYHLNTLSVDIPKVTYNGNLNKYKVRSLAKEAKLIHN